MAWDDNQQRVEMVEIQPMDKKYSWNIPENAGTKGAEI